MDRDQIRQRLFSQELRIVQGIGERHPESCFCPLHLRAVIPAERVTFALYVKTIVEDTKELRFLPFCAAGDIFQTAWLAGLRQLGIEYLYFQKENLAQVLAYLNNYLLFLECQGPDANRQKLEVFYEHLKLTLQQALNGPRLGPQIRAAVAQVDWILGKLADGALPLHMLWEILLRNYNLYHHAVNVFLISVALMLFLRNKSAACRTLGIAALFHDVGMFRISMEILHKPEGLSNVERQEIQKHPQLGYDLLKEYPAIPLEALRLVLEHHENSDGSGYPQGLELSWQHPHTRILRLVDAYEALTSQRPYRPAFSAYNALKILREQCGPRGPIYDQRLLQRFIKFLSV